MAVTRFGVQESTTGIVDTGACYPGCSPTNIPACQPMQFPNMAAFINYANTHNELAELLGTAIPNSPQWMAMQADAFSQCVQLENLPIPGGMTYQGGVTSITLAPGQPGAWPGMQPGGTYPPGTIPPPGTPIQQGGVPSGATVGQTKPGLTALYRFITYIPGSTDPNGPYATGANYPGCSQTNIANCRPKAFQTLQDAVDFAEMNGEIPYQVSSANEAWALINDQADIDPSKILGKHATHHPLSMATLGMIAIGLWFLSGR